jgi:hypothetical protein
MFIFITLKAYTVKKRLAIFPSSAGMSLTFFNSIIFENEYRAAFVYSLSNDE